MKIDPVRVLQRYIRRTARRVFPAPRTLHKAPLRRIPRGYEGAMLTLSDAPTITNVKFMNRFRENEQFDGVHADILDFYKAFRKELHDRKIPMMAFCFVRTSAEQVKMKANGVSNAGPGQSPHQYGLAVDIIHYRRGWDLTRKEWQLIGLIGLEVARKRNLKINWGGDETQLPEFQDPKDRFRWDPAHWELSDWKKLKQNREMH